MCIPVQLKVYVKYHKNKTNIFLFINFNFLIQSKLKCNNKVVFNTYQAPSMPYMNALLQICGVVCTKCKVEAP